MVFHMMNFKHGKANDKVINTAQKVLRNALTNKGKKIVLKQSDFLSF